MSGTIAAAFASLLMQQAAPYPSTLEPYRPPVVRPYEPTSNFGREQEAEGDETGDLHRRPIEAPVSVDAYARSYEFTPTDTETIYDQAVTSAEMRADERAGSLDGRWTATDARGRVLFGLVVSDPGGDSLVEGGWRAGHLRGVATVEAGVLMLEGRETLMLEQTPDGWRGLPADGRGDAVTFSRSR